MTIDSCYLRFASEDIQTWWLWGYWISPMMYGQNAIAVNEFLGKSWKHVIFSSWKFDKKTELQGI